MPPGTSRRTGARSDSAPPDPVEAMCTAGPSCGRPWQRRPTESPRSPAGRRPATFPFNRHTLARDHPTTRRLESFGGAGLRVSFLGTSSMLVRDDTTSVMIDGFVSRPPLRRVLLRRVSPDRDKVTSALRRLGVERLDAVLCAHSHMDHALDAPLVAELTEAQLVGSASTANVGRGWGLPEERLDVVGDGDARRFGGVDCEFVQVPHTPADPVPGTIDAPLVPPARFTAWRMGGDHAFLLTHEAGAILVNASTNFVPGKLADRHADVVYLGIATLGRQPQRFRQDYWDHVVVATGARRVIPVHWDDMRTSLDKPLKPLPRAADDLDTSLRFLAARGRADGVEVLLPHAWGATDPFEGL